MIRGVEPLFTEPEKKKKTNGPGKLCRHLRITRLDDGLDLTEGRRIWLEEGVLCPGESIVVTRRIGIESKIDSRDLPFRFTIDGNPFLSR